MGQGTEQLRAEIERRREDAGAVVDELEKRAGRALDVKRQVREHPVIAATAVAVPVLAAGATVVLLLRQRRNRRRFSTKAKHAAEDVREALETLRRSGLTITAQPAAQSDEGGVSAKLKSAALRGTATAISGLLPILARRMIASYLEREESARDRA